MKVTKEFLIEPTGIPHNSDSLFSRSFFWKILSLFMVNNSRKVSNQERVMMAHVRYARFEWAIYVRVGEKKMTDSFFH